MIAFIVLCSHHRWQFQDTFTPQKTLLAVMPTFPSSRQLLATINPFSLSMDLPILAIYIQYMESYNRCLTCLASFTWHVFQVPPCWSMYQSFIPSYGQITFHSMDKPHFIC